MGRPGTTTCLATGLLTTLPQPWSGFHLDTRVSDKTVLRVFQKQKPGTVVLVQHLFQRALKHVAMYACCCFLLPLTHLLFTSMSSVHTFPLPRLSHSFVFVCLGCGLVFV